MNISNKLVITMCYELFMLDMHNAGRVHVRKILKEVSHGSD